MAKKRIVHYLNQFYAGIGGEDMADVGPSVEEKVMGPGMALQAAFGDEAEIVATVICGDNYFGSNLEKEDFIPGLLEMIKKYEPDAFIAGPAFNAGRYGVACGAICLAVRDELKIPVVTGMYEENPGTDMYRKDMEIIVTKNSAADMRRAAPIMAKLLMKKLNGEEVLGPAIEGYHERGIRVNYWNERRGSERAVEMIVKKVKGEEFVTEYPIPKVDKVPPCAPLDTLRGKTVAIVTSGGIVPHGNPDHIESSSATKWGKYSIEGKMTATKEDWITVHGGYDRQYITEDPNLVLGLDVFRELEAEGVFGKLLPYFCTTVGTGTSTNNAKRFALEFLPFLQADGVDAVVVISTWGTCTRCGASMLKEIERVGIPVVHICTVTPISVAIGANRIVPAMGIPHPLGDPKQTPEKSKAIRRRLIVRALKTLLTPVDGQTVFEEDLDVEF